MNTLRNLEIAYAITAVIICGLIVLLFTLGL